MNVIERISHEISAKWKTSLTDELMNWALIISAPGFLNGIFKPNLVNGTAAPSGGRADVTMGLFPDT